MCLNAVAAAWAILNIVGNIDENVTYEITIYRCGKKKQQLVDLHTTHHGAIRQRTRLNAFNLSIARTWFFFTDWSLIYKCQRRPSVCSRTRNCTWKITIYYIICTVHASCKYFCAKTRNFDENKTVHVSMRVGFQKPKRKLPKRGSATNRPALW